jgi:hypothetical protein
MRCNIKQNFARLLLISLMAFTLVGIQVIQASPLHQHAEHSVDCGLCHLQLSDDAEIHHQHVITRIQRALLKAISASPFYSFVNPSPYQGRAPPL